MLLLEIAYSRRVKTKRNLGLRLLARLLALRCITLHRGRVHMRERDDAEMAELSYYTPRACESFVCNRTLLRRPGHRAHRPSGVLGGRSFFTREYTQLQRAPSPRQECREQPSLVCLSLRAMPLYSLSLTTLTAHSAISAARPSLHLGSPSSAVLQMLSQILVGIGIVPADAARR